MEKEYCFTITYKTSFVTYAKTKPEALTNVLNTFKDEHNIVLRNDEIVLDRKIDKKEDKSYNNRGDDNE